MYREKMKALRAQAKANSPSSCHPFGDRIPIDDPRALKDPGDKSHRYQRNFLLDGRNVRYLEQLKRQARRHGNTAFNSSRLIRAVLRALYESDLVVAMCADEQEMVWEVLWALRGKAKKLRYSEAFTEDEYMYMISERTKRKRTR